MNKRHFWLLVLLVVTLPMIAAIFQNTYTTQNPGQTPTIMSTTTSPMVPLAHIADDSDGVVHINPNVTYTRTNLNLTGNMTNNGVIISNLFRLISGAGANKVLTSDGSGNGTWQTPSAGSTSPTNTPIVLTIGGTGSTNVSGGDWSSGSASGTTFKLILTTNVLIGDATFSNVPTTNGQQNAVLYIIQDGTGTHTVTWTNSVFGFVNGVAPVQTTNAGAVDVYSLVNSLSTNGNIWVIPANNLHR